MCIRVLENNTEILCYCDDRAVQSVFKNQFSDNVSNHQIPSCNPTSRKLGSCNHLCVLGLLMYFDNSHTLFPSIFHNGSYDHEHKTCIVTMQIFKEWIV